MRKLQAILRFLLNRRKIEIDNDLELRDHIERQVEDNLRRGMTPAEARRSARLTFGGIEQIKEECRNARAGRMVESVWQDVRYSVRILLKNRGYAASAIVTLALGIGANTAIFSLVYGVLLRPLPYRNGERLVVLRQQAKAGGVRDLPFSPVEFADYRDHCHTLEAVVEHHQMQFLLFGKDTAEQVSTAVVSANFFDVLGVQPLLGRTFVAGDDRPGGDAVLVLSHKYWQSRGGDRDIVGRVFQMNNRPHTVIGVLPPIPQYPAESDVYMPTWQCPFRSNPANTADRRRFRALTVFGRLKPRVPLAQANADLSLVAQQLEAAHPEVYPRSAGYGMTAAPLRDELTGRGRTTFLVLLGAAGFVLLIACANVANLLLARLLTLERELAVRAALGATRLRITRQLITESVVISVLGGLAGLVLAPATLELLVRFAERFTTRAAEVRIDAPVLGFAVVVSMATGILLGLAASLSFGRRGSEALQQGGARSTPATSRGRVRNALVVGQVAVSFSLLIGAGLMIRSFHRLQRVDPGFSPDRLLTMRISPSFSHYDTPQKVLGLAEDVLRRVRVVAGIESAALISNAPFNPRGILLGPGSTEFEIEGRPVSKGELRPTIDLTVVSSDYFRTIRQPLVEGRVFTDEDDNSRPPVAVINRTMARHRWPSENPIGKRVTFDHGAQWVRVIGIVGDVKEYGLDRPVGDEMYLALRQNAFASNLVVRTAGDPVRVAPLVRAAVRAADSHVAVDQIATMERLRDDSFASPRVMTVLLGLFAGLALLISAGGVASVMALAVSRRTHELGIRMALGARRSAVVRMLMLEGLALALAGATLGICGAFVLTGSLTPWLYGTSPTDPLTYLAVSLLFLLVAALACFVPARKVTGIDPVIAIRQG